jgi:site-specific DNA-cytosine methylase
MLKKHDEDAPVEEVMRTLRSIPGYEVRGWKVNTLEFGLPQHRKRVYFVGVNTRKVKLLKKVKEWGPYLKKLQRPTQMSAHEFMLSDSEPEVRAEHEYISNRIFDRRHRSGSAASMFHAMARKHVIKNRAHGLKWLHAHRAYRQKHSLDGKGPWGGLRNGWAPFLGSERSKEVLEMAAHKVTRRMKKDAEFTSCISEVSRGIGFSVTMDRHTPCVTPTCRLWVYNRRRWLIGVEKLALQGFRPDQLDLSCLKESEIAMLAGNAMSVPVIGAFLLLAIAFIRFPAGDDKTG